MLSHVRERRAVSEPARGAVYGNRPAVPWPAQLVHLRESGFVRLGRLQIGIVGAQSQLVSQAPAELRFYARAAARFVAVSGAEEEGDGIEYVDDLIVEP